MGKAEKTPIMEQIIEFKGKNVSWFKYLNLLCKDRNIYIMDNHNAALWCWLQEIDMNNKYNILHIDRHLDTKMSRIDEWIANIPANFKALSIQEYLSLEYNLDNSKLPNVAPIMQWDNYLPIFHRLYRKNISQYYFITHKEGSINEEMDKITTHYPLTSLFNLLPFFFDEDSEKTYKWIVNIDLDYFFQKIDDTDLTLRIISIQSIEYIFEILKRFLKNRITVMTFALSPECCGSWENSLEVMRIIAKKLEIDFNIE